MKRRPTATPRPSGPQLGVVPHSPADLQRIQSGAAAGNPAFTYYLNPIAVVSRNLLQHGFAAGYQIYPQLKVIVTVQSGPRAGKYDVYLVQPLGHGVRGIWLINRILPHGQRSIAVAPTPTPGPDGVGIHLGYVPRNSANEQRIQAGANAGNPAYTYYLNPVAMVTRNLLTFGVRSPFTLDPSLTVRVFYAGKTYHIMLQQPLKRGSGGIWVMAAIRTA